MWCWKFCFISLKQIKTYILHVSASYSGVKNLRGHWTEPSAGWSEPQLCLALAQRSEPDTYWMSYLCCCVCGKAGRDEGKRWSENSWDVKTFHPVWFAHAFEQREGLLELFLWTITVTLEKTRFILQIDTVFKTNFCLLFIKWALLFLNAKYEVCYAV